MTTKQLISLLFLSFFIAACAPVSENESAESATIKPPQITLNTEQQVMVDELLSDMVIIPAGEFKMGDLSGNGEGDELPVRAVAVKAFAIGRYEISFNQYDVFAQATGRELPDDQSWGRDQRPVINVSWEDAMAFAQWLTASTGMAFRLPAEAEWEFVARSGASSVYSYGDDVSQLCQHGNTADLSAKSGWRNMSCADGFSTTAPVGSFQANSLGVYDMHGNVWEWVADCWYRNYDGAPDTSEAREGKCTSKGQRGGSWFYGTDEARSSYRSNGNVKDRSVTLGFRLARDL
jgi:formylglycine-generating enzyme required for sulfatase activity